MADAKVSALTAAAAALGADEIPINEAGTNKKLTVTQLSSFVLAAGLYAPGSLSIPTGGYYIGAGRFVLTGSQSYVGVGTSILAIIGGSPA